ncbi:MAG: biotin--[Bacteroidales bacterium]|nr:biotin--[acetyl-CoA-carboxylase] ligase [Bacteroidales bacterium]
MKSNPVIIWLDVAESSNDEARRAIDSLDNLSVVAVRCQTKGRGQRTNTWETAPGQNLTFSIVLKDLVILPSEQIAISQITALSVVDFLALHGIEAKIKLPNDIYVGYKKICGILIENSICSNNMKWSIIGVGINVNQTTFPSSLPNPTSILLECDRTKLDLDTNPDLLLNLDTNLDLNTQLEYFHKIFSSYHTKYLSRRIETSLDELEHLFKSKLLAL